VATASEFLVDSAIDLGLSMTPTDVRRAPAAVFSLSGENF
jgi:hypothetical protein